MKTYSERLRDPRWQKKRLATLEAAGWMCENCGDKESTLNVHHKRYLKGKMPWEYDKEWLAVLCEGCHGEEHSRSALLDQVLAFAPVGSIGQIAGLAAGYLDASVDIEDPAFVEQVRQVFPAAFEIGVVASVAESMGVFGWRELVRSFASKNPSTPPIRSLIAMWDQESADSKAA